MRSVYTTVQIAKICRVSSEQVRVWIDRGLLAGYRLPSKNRPRIVRHADLTRFMEEHGISEQLGQLGPSRLVLTVGMLGADHQRLADMLVSFGGSAVAAAGFWDLGYRAARDRPFGVVLDCHAGRDLCVAAARRIVERWPWVGRVCVPVDDGPVPGTPEAEVFDALLDRPVLPHQACAGLGVAWRH